MTRLIPFLPLVFVWFLSGPAVAAEPSAVDGQFEQTIQPLLKRFCVECHQGSKAEAMLDLTRFTQPRDVARSHQTWAEIRDRVAAGEMPPTDAPGQPSTAERERIVEWINAFRQQEATRRAGDPGLVPVRRLSNSELNYTIRDLTGVDIRPTREFPVDPANEAGFDNSADSLTTSPALLAKSLAAARHVAEHMVLTPDGIDFAPHPAMTDTDRDKYCVKRIVDFYLRQPTDYADYFFAAWQIRRSSQPVSIDAFEGRLSSKYLRTIIQLLSEERPILNTAASDNGESQIGIGPLAVLRGRWRDLPQDPNAVEEVKAGCRKLRDFVIELRRRLEPEVKGLNLRGIHNGAQPFVLWKNDQYAANRQLADLDALGKLAPGAENRMIHNALSVPESDLARERFVAEIQRFCRIFPDAFYVSERGRDYVGKPKAEQEKGRLLSAGFHSMMGYYRDDEPLMKLMLSPADQQRLDRLWQELDFVTSAPMRQYTGFVWFERTDSATMRGEEFDFARAEDKSVTTPAMIDRLAETYLAKADALGADETIRGAIERYFRRINEQIQSVEHARRLAEPHHVEALVRLATQAYRRDLTASEMNSIRDFYHQLRTQDQLGHEEAIQDCLVSILMSPEVNFRVDLAARQSQRAPLDDWALASRLSYFLWSSMPDEELRRLARSGTLHTSENLRAQVQRMMRDPRIEGLATEFGGQWLDFRRFEEHNSVDRQRFPAFTDQLRTAMFQEPIQFLKQMLRDDRSVLDCLYSDKLIVNEELARHYGITSLEEVTQAKPIGEGWYEVPASAAGSRDSGSSNSARGGLLGMSVFLTQNAPGRRTSPVKRGYWVVRRLLGEHIPPPPPNVPELPSDEAQLGSLTLRETLARHRDHASCAGCHNRFDSIGIVFESFGPIGELRKVDLAGNAVDTRAVMPDGKEAVGIEGLKEYLRNHRQDDFIDNLSRKLLSFALGRTLLLSDEPLLADMRKELAVHEYRVSSLIETIVLSPQFLTKRGAAESSEE